MSHSNCHLQKIKQSSLKSREQFAEPHEIIIVNVFLFIRFRLHQITWRLKLFSKSNKRISCLAHLHFQCTIAVLNLHFLCVRFLLRLSNRSFIRTWRFLLSSELIETAINRVGFSVFASLKSSDFFPPSKNWKFHFITKMSINIGYEASSASSSHPDISKSRFKRQKTRQLLNATPDT